MDNSVQLTTAQAAINLLRLRGAPYTLKEYPMFTEIYNTPATRVVMRSGRQVSKSTVLAGRMLVTVTTTPFTSAIYCNSSSDQTSSFSNSKLQPFIKLSPQVYNRLYIGGDKDSINNVLHKKFSNHSEIILSYFADAADRVRGRSGDVMYLDEIQDMLYDAMIDAEECLSAAKNPKVVYAGTSKSLITPLEFLWSQSTQNYWIIPCEHCNAHNVPDKRNIGKEGLICKKCGKDINTYNGYWASMNPGTDKYADGFWIPQIIMPMHCMYKNKWDLLLQKLERYPEIKFDNEVMGLPYGDGDSPITEEMLREMCLDYLPMEYKRTHLNSEDADFLVAGIDWGGGGELGVSRTVLSIYAVYGSRPEYRKIFGKIYDEGEPVNHVQDIAKWIVIFGVQYVAGDHGGGNFAMSLLRQNVPPEISITPVMYSDASAPYSWNERSKHYTVNRTVLIDNFFTDIQQGNIKCFRWAEFQPFAKDILNIRQIVMGEDRGVAKRVWRHGPRDPDDSLHSMVFGWFMARIMTGRTTFTIS